jgi:hypothetical protein
MVNIWAWVHFPLPLIACSNIKTCKRKVRKIGATPVMLEPIALMLEQFIFQAILFNTWSASWDIIKTKLTEFLITTCSRTFCTCSSYISKSNSSQLGATAVVTNEGESKIAVLAEEDWAPCCSSSPTSGSENLPLCVRDDPISVLCTSSETFPATNCIAPTRAVVLRVTLALFSSPPFSIASCCASLPHTLASSSVQTTAHFVITG